MKGVLFTRRSTLFLGQSHTYDKKNGMRLQVKITVILRSASIVQCVPVASKIGIPVLFVQTCTERFFFALLHALAVVQRVHSAGYAASASRSAVRSPSAAVRRHRPSVRQLPERRKGGGGLDPSFQHSVYCSFMICSASISRSSMKNAGVSLSLAMLMVNLLLSMLPSGFRGRTLVST